MLFADRDNSHCLLTELRVLREWRVCIWCNKLIIFPSDYHAKVLRYDATERIRRKRRIENTITHVWDGTESKQIFYSTKAYFGLLWPKGEGDFHVCSERMEAIFDKRCFILSLLGIWGRPQVTSRQKEDFVITKSHCSWRRRTFRDKKHNQWFF